MTTATHPLYTVLGTTDERDTCDCCGRTNLKSVVALRENESGEDVFFGSTCAARAMKWTTKATKAAVKAADDAKADAERAARAAAQRAAHAVWVAFLDAKVPALRGEVFRQIESLGGHRAARAAFNQEQ